MALQGKVLNRLCRSLWRLNVSGSGAQVDTVLQSSPSCQRLHHHHPSSSTALPASLHLSPPCLHATSDSSSSSSLPTVLRTEDPVAAHTKNSSNWQKEADSSILSRAVLKNKSHMIKEASNMSVLTTTTTTTTTPLGLRIWDVNQAGRRQGLNLASWPDTQHMEYSCPSEKLTSLPELTFLDPAPLVAPCELPQSSTPTTSTTILPIIIIHDPLKPTTAEISDPSERESDPRNAPKEARKIMKIRRKKMKRHLLKKFRKRMAFTLRKIKRERRKKKEAVFQARLGSIQEWGDSFDARHWVREQLDKARRGGFYINVLEGQRDRQSGSNP